MLTNLLQRGWSFIDRLAVPGLVVGLLAATLIGPLGHAVEITSLYTVEVSLDPEDPDAQKNSYRTALIEALIRSTGSSATANAEELEVLFSNPIRYVLQQQVGSNNTLIVTLDGPAIERTLRDSGVPIWGSDRPLTIIWLAIDWGLGDREIISAADSSYSFSSDRFIDRNHLLRERVHVVAARYGVPIIFPLLDIEDLERIDFIDIWGGFDGPLLDASSRYQASSVLVGRIRTDDLASPRWTWHMGEQRIDWVGQPEQAIEQLAEALVLSDVAQGQHGNESLELNISGIQSIHDYGQVQRYIENIRGVESLMVEMVVSNRITYLVKLQGRSNQLKNTLALSGFLEEEDENYAADDPAFEISGENGRKSLYYRYRPLGPSSSSMGDEASRNRESEG